MSNMFNKIIRKQGGGVSIELREQAQKKIKDRVEFLIKEINAVFETNSVTLFEAVDVLNTIKINVDVQISKLVVARDNEINQLKNDIAKSKNGGGEEGEK